MRARSALPGPRTFRCESVLLSILLLLTLVGSSSADWPQWRGASGLGVSAELGLPAVLAGDSPDLKWKVPLRGSGISSPIVHGGRVYLTTAYPGTEQSRAALFKLALAPALLLATLALWALALRRRAADRGAPGDVARGLRGLLFRLDSLATGLTTLAFVAVALAITFESELFWPAGVHGEAWFFTGATGLVGIVAALGWSRPSSPVRILGALVLVAAGVWLFREIGWNQYGLPFKTLHRWAMIAPGLAGAAWHVAVFCAGLGRSPARTFHGGAAPFSALAAAIVLFVTYNLWQPSAGLMRAVIAFDLATGELLWDTGLFVAPEEQKYPMNSFATPTPCTDGERIFAYFGSGWACLDMDGEVLWTGRDPAYAPNTRYGLGTSPLSFEDMFLVLRENEFSLDEHPSYLLALDKETGREVYRVHPQPARDTYSTPVLMPREGSTELVRVSAALVIGHDPRTGAELWRLPLPVRQMVPSPIFDGDLLFVAGGTHGDTSTTAVRLGGAGKETRTETLWQTTKGVPGVCSPVLHNDCLFTLTNGGILTCFDPLTGEVRWKERLAGEYWASLVAGDEKVYAFSEEGTVTVVAARPEFEVLSTTELGEQCVASPAISDGAVMVRTDASLYCFQKNAGL